MTWPRAFLVCVILLWVAGGCQQSVASSFAIGGAVPDFLFVALSVLALQTSRKAGTVAGFAAGAIHGGIAGANFAAYALTRTIAGFFLGWLSSSDIDVNFVAAGLITFIATLVTQFVFMLIAPPPAIWSFLLATIGVAIYNGVLAMPVQFLVAKAMPPKER